MDKYLFKFRFLILGLILVLGLVLRQNDLYTWPRLGATFDEYAWVWLGINLIQNHVPISWSPHPQYENKKDIIYQKAHFVLVKPYLEHPPFFGLVAGSYALVNGAKDVFDIDLSRIRGLALILGILSIFIIYVFAAEVYGYKIGLLSSFIYATVPTIVIGSRLVQNENFFIPFFLLSLYLTIKFVKTKNSVFRNVAAVVCGFLALSKAPWVVAGISIFLIFLFLKRYKDALKFIAIVIPIFSLYFLYGIYFDSKLFFDLLGFQLQRYDLTFNSFFALFTSPYLVDRFLIDGWIYFGWFAIFILSLKNFRKNYLLLLPFLTYFFIFIFAIPNEPQHGWYRYPFYPFLVISIALFIKEYFNKNRIYTLLLLMFTGLSMLQLTWATYFGFSFIVLRLFLVLCGLSLLPLFFPKTLKKTNMLNTALLTFIFLLNIWSVFLYNEQ
ncbi:MAG: glycosyltransferase family 39 protein [Candidatus Levybacteria bacterium]|nr:glycosyltransferase family 39 protein [Candidatus Levybacteria bacterium]